MRLASSQSGQVSLNSIKLMWRWIMEINCPSHMWLPVVTGSAGQLLLGVVMAAVSSWSYRVLIILLGVQNGSFGWLQFLLVIDWVFSICQPEHLSGFSLHGFQISRIIQTASISRYLGRIQKTLRPIGSCGISLLPYFISQGKLWGHCVF